MSETSPDELARDLAPISATAVAPAHGIATVALSLAMKYHEINTVSDGTLYQQYKLEGKNMTPLRLAEVFETAIQIERHLLASSERIAAIVVDALTDSSLDGEKRDPYAEGLDARLAGWSEDKNPYDPEAEPDAYSSWNDGWASTDNEEGSGEEA